jgi:hypothetical protein
MYNLLPNINDRSRFVINKDVTLYVSEIGGLSTSDEYSIKKKHLKLNTLTFTQFKI